DALLEALHRLEDRALAADPAARELELGVVGESLDPAVEVVVVEREQVARHQVLDLGAIARVVRIVNLHVVLSPCRDSGPRPNATFWLLGRFFFPPKNPRKGENAHEPRQAGRTGG